MPEIIETNKISPFPNVREDSYQNKTTPLAKKEPDINSLNRTNHISNNIAAVLFPAVTTALVTAPFHFLKTNAALAPNATTLHKLGFSPIHTMVDRIGARLAYMGPSYIFYRVGIDVLKDSDLGTVPASLLAATISEFPLLGLDTVQTHSIAQPNKRLTFTQIRDIYTKSYRDTRLVGISTLNRGWGRGISLALGEIIRNNTNLPPFFSGVLGACLGAPLAAGPDVVKTAIQTGKPPSAFFNLKTLINTSKGMAGRNAVAYGTFMWASEYAKRNFL